MRNSQITNKYKSRYSLLIGGVFIFFVLGIFFFWRFNVGFLNYFSLIVTNIENHEFLLLLFYVKFLL